MGPAFVMTDFGWGGATDKSVLALTRAFVHFLHQSHVQVVTLADLEMDGSHNMSNNMQPPLQPSSRAKFALGVQKLTANAAGMLAGAPANAPASPLAVAAGADPRLAVAAAALKMALASGAGGAVAADMAAATCMAVALAQVMPLGERSFPVSPDQLEAWRAGSGKWGPAAEDFLVAFHAGVAAVLRAPGAADALQAAVTKDAPVTVADVIDGRFVLVVLITSLAVPPPLVLIGHAASLTTSLAVRPRPRPAPGHPVGPGRGA